MRVLQTDSCAQKVTRIKLQSNKKHYFKTMTNDCPYTACAPRNPNQLSVKFF